MLGWLTFAVSFTGVIAIPALVLTIRLTIKWTRIEDRQELALSNYAELAQTMREDRNATNLRLRWLEETLWKYGPRPGPLSFRYHSGIVPLPTGLLPVVS